MPEKQLWLVTADREYLGVTDDLGVAYTALRDAYGRDIGATEEDLARTVGPVLDLKLGDWFLVTIGRRNRLYGAMKINRL